MSLKLRLASRITLDSDILQVLRTSLPLVIVELVSSLYSIADTYFVKNLGENAIAALGISGYIFWLVQAFFALFHTPLSIAVAQSVGAKELAKARSILGFILLLGCTLTATSSAILAYRAPWIIVVQSNAKGLTFNYAVEYLRIRFCGLVIAFAAMSLDVAVVSAGKTVYSMISNTVGLALNMFLDPLIIYGLYGFPKFEVAGAAIATVISQTISLLLNSYFILKIGLIPTIEVKQQLSTIRMLNLGFFSFLERLLFSLGNNVYAGIISRLGDLAMAAHSIGLRIESLIYMPGIAFLTTASVLVGQKIGARSIEEAKNIGLKVIKLGSTIMALLGLSVALCSYKLTSVFAPNIEVQRLASIYLIIAGLNEFGLGLTMITGGAIRGAGNVIAPFTINLGCLFLVRVTLSFLLAPMLGVIGPWTAMFVDVYLRGFILYYMYTTRFNKLVKRIV
ncbi:MAG: MATE family efflux transporter [Ignisphaera sp.]|uniref:Multidrug-efflux transporter n=1 Tax=Ignisphaera aggregans TaxID=334771 RepID=A0A7C4JJN8_9CREN